VERWIAGLALNPDPDAEPGLQKSAHPQSAAQFISDEEDEAIALELAARYR
jgi:hypothetical protein